MEIFDPKTETRFFSKRRRRFERERNPRELTFSCYHRYQFLSRDRTRQWFVEELQRARLEWRIDLWAWVLMPEHVHLLVAPRESGIDVGRFQGVLKERVARRAIRWMKDHAPNWLSRITVQEGKLIRRRFWQPGGGYDRNIDNLATLKSVIEYIHHNPVRRGLVEQAIDWDWSSARWYAGEINALLEMDRSLPIFQE